MTTAASASRVDERIASAWKVLDGVPDPEVPVISVVELGIVRDVRADARGLQVVMTPTYSGCPALDAIESDIRAALEDAGLGPVEVSTQRAPAWTTDWISAEGRRKLHEYGIVPPGAAPVGRGRAHDATAGVPIRFVPSRTVRLTCPRCGSNDTERLAAFGSTACKSLHRCRACLEPFEHFKAL